jgi:hypothetical protein
MIGIFSNYIFLIITLLWILPWMTWSLWRAARNNQRIWFIALIIFQTIGILPILYIFVFQKNRNKRKNLSVKLMKSKKTPEFLKKFINKIK